MKPKITIYERAYWERLRAAKNSVIVPVVKSTIERMSPTALKYRIEYLKKIKQRQKPLIGAEMDE